MRLQLATNGFPRRFEDRTLVSTSSAGRRQYGQLFRPVEFESASTARSRPRLPSK